MAESWGSDLTDITRGRIDSFAQNVRLSLFVCVVNSVVMPRSFSHLSFCIAFPSYFRWLEWSWTSHSRSMFCFFFSSLSHILSWCDPLIRFPTCCPSSSLLTDISFILSWCSGSSWDQKSIATSWSVHTLFSGSHAHTHTHSCTAKFLGLNKDAADFLAWATENRLHQPRVLTLQMASWCAFHDLFAPGEKEEAGGAASTTTPKKRWSLFLVVIFTLSRSDVCVTITSLCLPTINFVTFCSLRSHWSLLGFKWLLSA